MYLVPPTALPLLSLFGKDQWWAMTEAVAVVRSSEVPLIADALLQQLLSHVALQTPWLEREHR